jgi:hypothetical protein
MFACTLPASSPSTSFLHCIHHWLISLTYLCKQIRGGHHIVVVVAAAAAADTAAATIRTVSIE